LSEKGKTVTHRIKKAYLLGGKIPSFVTQGDANSTPDLPIVSGQVQGKVVWSMPYIGSLLEWTHTIIGILIIIYLPALIIIIDEIKRLGAYYRQYVPYKTALILARERDLAENARSKFKLTAVPIISLLIVAGSVLFAFPVQAMLKSNNVALTNNRITVKKPTAHTCTNTTNTNNINISSTTTQTGTSGNVTNTNNTNTGNSTSGDVNNSNNTNISITITNC
jgi:hypothetical protein